MDNPNPILYSDLVKPDSSITDLIDQLTRLVGKYEEAQDVIKSKAAETTRSMQQLSGATEEQRRAILQNAEASEKLLAEYQNLRDDSLNAKIAQQQLNAANREQNQIAKLLVEVNRSAEGSYKRLSAQYRLNKIALNEMSESERTATEFGRKLEAETRAIYEQMNEMQKATGKAQLQVGQYERALGGAIGVNQTFVSVLTDSSKAADTFRGVLNVLKTPVGAVIGLVGAATAAFKLWQSSVHETQASGDALDSDMAGWTATWDVFKKAVATMDFSGFIRQAAEAARAGRELKAILDETFERTNSVRLMRASMSQENALLEEAMRNANLSYEERLDAAEKYLANMQPIYDQELETARRNRDAQLRYLFELTNKRQFASEQERDAAAEEFAANIKNYNLNEDLFKQAAEYNRLVERRGKLYDYVSTAAAAAAADKEAAYIDSKLAGFSTDVKAFSDFVRQYNLTSDKQVSAYVEAQIKLDEAAAASYNDQKRIVTLKNSLLAQEASDRQKAAADVARAAKEQAAAEKKASEDAVRAKEKEMKDKEAAERQAEADAERARQQEIADKRAMLQLDLQRVQLQLQITQESTEEALQLRLAANEKQREIELFENSQRAENLRQDEAAINAKYDALALKTQADFRTKLAQRDLAASQDLASAEFNLLDRNERQKTLFRLEQERRRLEEILRINETAAEKMTDVEVEAVRKTIEGIKQETARTGFNNIYEVLGLNIRKDQQDALGTALSYARDLIGNITDAWVAAADAAVASANKQVDAARKMLDEQISLREQGYANDVATAQKELALAQSQQEAAEKRRQKAQRAQLAADSITQASSLVTASANIWSSLSSIPIVGPALAVASIATMWGSFAAAKIKALQMSRTEQYGDGTVELLQGGSHASGNDIDLGTKSDGTRRRAEGGEYFAVINKRNSRRYRDVIPDVIRSFNDGTFAEKYQRASSDMSGFALSMIGAGGTDVSKLERGVDAIRRQGERSRFIDADGNTVEVYKNITRKIYKS